jgi:amidase
MPPSKKPKLKRPWQDIAKEAQDHRDASIEPVLGITGGGGSVPEKLPKNSMSVSSNTLSPGDNEITELLPEQLTKLLASGKFSSKEVTTAFLRRAALAQKLVRKI